MKKTIFTLCLSIFVAMGIASAQQIEASENRKTDSFNALKINGAINVELIASSVEDIKISTIGIEPSEVLVEVKNGELIIDLLKKKNVSYNRKMSVKAVISYKAMQSIRINGTGSVKSAQTLKSENIALEISGTGSIKLALASENLQANISGTGSMNLIGSTNNATIIVSGTGSFDGNEITVNSAKVDLRGTGSIKIGTSQQISGSLSGVGSIRYKGSPSVNVTKTGMGSIKQSN